MELTEDGVVVELSHEGEGFFGDFNYEDPEDAALLRFWVSLENPRADDPDYPHDASYCTLLPASLSDEEQRLVAEAIMRRVKDDVLAGTSIKRVCEELSWLDEQDVERLKGER